MESKSDETRVSSTITLPSVPYHEIVILMVGHGCDIIDETVSVRNVINRIKRDDELFYEHVTPIYIAQTSHGCNNNVTSEYNVSLANAVFRSKMNLKKQIDMYKSEFNPSIDSRKFNIKDPNYLSVTKAGINHKYVIYPNSSKKEDVEKELPYLGIHVIKNTMPFDINIWKKKVTPPFFGNVSNWKLEDKALISLQNISSSPAQLPEALHSSLKPVEGVPYSKYFCYLHDIYYTVFKWYIDIFSLPFIKGQDMSPLVITVIDASCRGSCEITREAALARPIDLNVDEYILRYISKNKPDYLPIAMARPSKLGLIYKYLKTIETLLFEINVERDTNGLPPLPYSIYTYLNINPDTYEDLELPALTRQPSYKESISTNAHLNKLPFFDTEYDFTKGKKSKRKRVKSQLKK
jgi:hypothetical protein